MDGIMEQWLNVQTLIWLFPIMFVLHDFEEIIMVERWMKRNSTVIYDILPERIADRVINQFSMSTAQFAVAVLVVFLFVSSSTVMANQYVIQGLLGNIYFSPLYHWLFLYILLLILVNLSFFVLLLLVHSLR